MDEKHIYEILNLAEDEVDAVSDARVVPRAQEDESEEHYVSRPSKSGERSAAKSKSSGKKKTAAKDVKKKSAAKKESPAAAAAADIAKANAAAAKVSKGGDAAEALPIINGVPTERRKKPRTKPDPEYDLRYPDYTIQLTKGLTNTVVKRVYLAHKKGQFLLLSAFLLGLLVLCFIVFAVIQLVFSQRRLNERATEIASLRSQIETLSEDNAELRNRVTQLSVSVNRNIEDRRAQAAADEEALMPKGFPLSQYAVFEIVTEEDLPALLRAQEGEDAADEENTDEENADTDAEPVEAAEDEENTDEENTDDENTDTDEAPEDEEPAAPAAPEFVAHFEAPVGSRVLASGGGVVTRVIPDDQYGTRLVVDHRNGYTSVYRNRAEAKVKVGDSVKRGDTLFVIGEEHTRFGYQIRYNETALDPSELIQIGG
ncbi:MAG: M23 family metallopeptidase [Lachnospiraceae bacterium]|nr:M23 family metallopeptidase [Lachnospiraceae bacterium]